MITNLQLVSKLQELVDDSTGYSEAPTCFGYVGEDCLLFSNTGLLKAIIWDNSIGQNRTLGYQAQPDPSTGLGDWNATKILSQCSLTGQISTTGIAILSPGTLLCSSDRNAIGIYIGDGECIEATQDWDLSGVIRSIITPEGDRLCYYTEEHEKEGSWDYWGIMPWVKYEAQPAPQLRKGAKAASRSVEVEEEDDQEYKVRGSDLRAVADAIREQTGTSEDLSFPDEFASAIRSISTGTKLYRHTINFYSANLSTFTVSVISTSSINVVPLVEPLRTQALATLLTNSISCHLTSSTYKYPCNVTINSSTLSSNSFRYYDGTQWAVAVPVGFSSGTVDPL